MAVSRSGKPYYTAEQLNYAKQRDLIDYAQSQGYKLVKKGSDYVMADHDSMVFRPDGQWHWNSQNFHGRLLEFMIYYEHRTLPEAVNILTADMPQTQANTQEFKPKEKILPQEKKEFVMPEKAANNKKMIDYLINERGIDAKIVSTLITRGKLFQTNPYNNAAFIFQTPKGDPVGAFMRGTLDREGKPSFRGMATNSDRSAGCFYFGKKDSTLACVFEAAIDAMSYATLQKLGQNPDWNGRYYIASGGAGTKNVDAFLEAHKDISSVVLCQDNDAAGHKQAEEMAERLREKGYQVSRSVPHGKDFNDDLLAKRAKQPQRGQQREVQAAEGDHKQQEKSATQEEEAGIRAPTSQAFSEPMEYEEYDELIMG